MSTLHIINRAISDRDCWQDCLNHCANSDSLLLIENAVYAALERPAGLDDTVEFLVLEADVQARGLDTSNLVAKVVTDTEFVQLCVSHEKNLSWF